MDWSDILKLALSIFLVLTGAGLAYLFLRLAGVFGRLGVALTRITDEVVPILSRAQTTMDGVNRELDRVDEIMVTAVNTTKGAERAVGTVSAAVTAPVRKLTGVAEGAREAWGTFRARRRQQAADDAAAAEVAAPSPAPAPAARPIAAEPPGSRHESPY